MERVVIAPRADWERKVSDYGLTFHTMNGELYWDESAYYRFSADEVDTLEDATNELHRMCLHAVDVVIREGRFAPFLIPDTFIPLLVESWERQEGALYGRFDFCYDGAHSPKLLEYNADTPTALLEASVIQWFWLQEVAPDADQFNSIHEHLLERLRLLKEELGPLAATIFYFTSVANMPEDFITTSYLRDLAMQSGFATEYLTIRQIGWHEARGVFTDLRERAIHLLFKLYPWEWLVREAFAPHLLQRSTRWVEPMWKMLLSNKALLPLLWELYPDHPNLLRAGWEPLAGDYARKPILAREGANVTLVVNGQTMDSPGPYGASPVIYQQLSPLPCFDGNYPVVGSWVVGDTACGMGIREDRTPITRNTSRFIPHLFR